MPLLHPGPHQGGRPRGRTSAADVELIALKQRGEWPAFLELAVKSRKNILISGATGSGKTTLSKALIQLIPSEERLLTIEDTRELLVPHRNAVHQIGRATWRARVCKEG